MVAMQGLQTKTPEFLLKSTYIRANNGVWQHGVGKSGRIEPVVIVIVCHSYNLYHIHQQSQQRLLWESNNNLLLVNSIEKKKIL
jgi:hypothetical protein